MANVILYHRTMCPYCRKVRDYLNSHSISIPMKELGENPAHKQELSEIGGKGQVPCLAIDGKPLYESDDIIKWFEDNWKE